MDTNKLQEQINELKNDIQELKQMLIEAREHEETMRILGEDFDKKENQYLNSQSAMWSYQMAQMAQMQAQLAIQEQARQEQARQDQTRLGQIVPLGQWLNTRTWK